jgi:hypothetical protein
MSDLQAISIIDLREGQRPEVHWFERVIKIILPMLSAAGASDMSDGVSERREGEGEAETHRKATTTLLVSLSLTMQQ